MFKAGIGKVGEPGLEGYGQILSAKPVYTGTADKVKLKARRQVRLADAGPRDTSTAFQERHPARAGGKVIPQQRRETGHVGIVWIQLPPAEDLAHQFPVAAIPVVLRDHAGQDASDVRCAQDKIVRFAAAEHPCPQPAAE